MERLVFSAAQQNKAAPSAKLFQRQEKLRDILMFRHLREEGDALAVEREVARLLAASR